MDQKKIGRFISELRGEKSLTQAELGEKLGVTNKTVSRWENGNYMPDISVMLLICKLFDIGINELLSGKRLDDDDFRKEADDNVVLSLQREKTIGKKKRVSEFLGGSGTGFLISTLYSPNSTVRTVVIVVSIAMILFSWYFRALYDRDISGKNAKSDC